MPKNGIPASSTWRSSATSDSAVAGSPGPLEKNTPSGSRAATSSNVAHCGSTCTSMPCSAISCGVIALIPRSIAATRNRFSPTASTTYGSVVETSPARAAPAIEGAVRTRSASTVGDAPAYSSPLKIPTRMAPRSRR